MFVQFTSCPQGASSTTFYRRVFKGIQRLISREIWKTSRYILVEIEIDLPGQYFQKNRKEEKIRKEIIVNICKLDEDAQTNKIKQ